MRCQRVSYLTLSLSLAIPFLVASGSACSSTTPPLTAQGLSTPEALLLAHAYVRFD